MAFIVYKLVPINKAADVIYKSFIKDNYTIYNQESLIIDMLNYFFSNLKEEIKVFIEYPYVDKVYRDSYYCYFATKHKAYSRDCIRLSFFSRNIAINDIASSANEKKLADSFLGYCVLRPTFPNIIGRNLLSKMALKNQDFVTCIHEENILINGHKLVVKGYPHSSQDQESITCAETTIWALMEYFGHKYPEYKPVLPSVIINKLNERSDRRMLPSNGLTPEQISYALKDFGFGTLIYTKEDDDKDFLIDLAVYIESGIPVIVAVVNADATYAHAFLMIGRETTDKEKLLGLFSSRQKLIPFYSSGRKYIVQDDNLNPYAQITLDNPGINYEATSAYASYQIQSFVVPLYRKIYMEAKAARNFMSLIFKDSVYGSKSSKKHIFRPFLASSRSLKQHLALQDEMDGDLKEFILALSMPRFVYCGEFIDEDDAPNGMVSSLIILDATEVCDNWEDSFIFAAHKKQVFFSGLFNNRHQIIPLDFPFTSYRMYQKNLN